MKFIETSELCTFILAFLLAVSIAFSQKTAKFEIPLDSSGAQQEPANIAPKLDTIPQETAKFEIPPDSSGAQQEPANIAPKPDTIPQETVKFEIPLDFSGTQEPANIAPKPDTIQKLWLTKGMSLNLSALSAKDTDNFDIYSLRLALINDSISSNYATIETAKKNAEAVMPQLEPKGEFEKQAEYEARAQKWQSDLAQRAEKESKQFAYRNEQLEKAKIKVLENQASLYGSIEIKTTPSGVSVFLGKEEIGTSPMLYKLLIPGTTEITFKKDGYHQYNTILQIKSGEKLKMDIEIEEKSMFSQKNEINFSKILSKNTNIEGYKARIKTIKARSLQIDGEIKDILANFANEYTLKAQRPNESAESFNVRRDAWQKEGQLQYLQLRKKYEDYKSTLNRAEMVLSDYILAMRSSIVSEVALNAKIELGAYDADKEVFALMAQDTVSDKSPFLFSGMVAVPRDVAKNMNRNAPGFATGLQFINYPFETEAGKVNLAMSKLSILNNGKELKVDGSFSEIGRYKAIEGYAAWKLYADSLLSGALKPQNLDYNYAMGKEAAKKAVADEGESTSESVKNAMSKKIALTLAVSAGVFGGLALYNNFEMNRYVNEANSLAYNRPDGWYDEFKSLENQVKYSKTKRNVFGVFSGVSAVTGIFAFFF